MLPSIEEFRSEVENCTRLIKRTVFVSIGGMFLLMLVAVAAREFSEESLGPVLSKSLPAICLAVGFPLMLFGFWRADQYHKKFTKLSCAHCGKPLVKSSDIVVASRNCPHCGRQVVAAPAA